MYSNEYDFYLKHQEANGIFFEINEDTLELMKGYAIHVHDKQNWSECECKDCGHKWNASDTEHFNISFCNSCHGTNIGGKYYDQEDKWSDVYDAFHTAIEESALQVTTEYHDLEEETHTLAEECKRIHEVMMQRDVLGKAAKHLLNLYDNPIVTTETSSWSKQITLAYEDLRKALNLS